MHPESIFIKKISLSGSSMSSSETFSVAIENSLNKSEPYNTNNNKSIIINKSDNSLHQQLVFENKT